MLIHKSLLCSRFSSSTSFLAAIDRTHSIKNIIGQPQFRNVWKFTHVYMPERTPDGLAQRPPTDHPDFQKYTCYFDEEFNNPAPPFKIILLQDIEELGEKFDIVEAEPDIARRAILEKKASYASPFDLEYYGRKKKEWLASEEGKKFKIPRELTKFGKELANKIIPVLVSMTIEWTLNVEMLAISLQKAGINVPIESVHLAIPADGPIKGPNLNEDARLFRFYIIIDNQMIVPMLGRLTHVSTEETNLFPSEEKFQNAPTDPQQLAQFGLRPETLYYNVNGIAETIDGKDVAKFMGASRPSDAVTGVN